MIKKTHIQVAVNGKGDVFKSLFGYGRRHAIEEGSFVKETNDRSDTQPIIGAWCTLAAFDWGGVKVGNGKRKSTVSSGGVTPFLKSSRTLSIIFKGSHSGNEKW